MPYTAKVGSVRMNKGGNADADYVLIDDDTQEQFPGTAERITTKQDLINIINDKIAALQRAKDTSVELAGLEGTVIVVK